MSIWCCEDTHAASKHAPSHEMIERRWLLAVYVLPKPHYRGMMSFRWRADLLYKARIERSLLLLFSIILSAVAISKSPLGLLHGPWLSSFSRKPGH